MGDAWGSWDSHSRPRQYPVPSWEKRFCTSVCSIPWGRILVAKASLSAYKGIADWDDTAALEAFNNAKARYWSSINGLPCNIPLPDPNLYIDNINHNPIIDPKLVEDLEKRQTPPHLSEENNEESRLVIDINTGWAGNWDKFLEKTNNVSGKGDSSNAWNCCDGWGSGGNDNSWNNGREDTWVQNWNNLDNSWNCRRDDSWGQNWNNLNKGQGRRDNYRKRNGDNYDSRFSKSRKTNNYSENRVTQQPMFMRHSEPRRSRGPINYQRATESAGAW